MSKALINPEVLRWAAARSGVDVSVIAEKLTTSPDRVESWLSGKELPTFRQAQRLATQLNIPFGYLYLPEPPEEQIPIAEFRRLPGVSSRLSRDVLDLLSDIDFKRDWYLDYLDREGAETLEFVGRFSLEDPAPLIAGDIRKELSRESNSLFVTRKSYERFLEELLRAAERIGVWIMRSGVVGNNTHRPIPVSTLRGFAISDDWAPIIFLNGKDAKSAQIFTFAHELSHLWIGRSSLEFGSLEEISSIGDAAVEAKCNAIAAEVLVPGYDFVRHWRKGVELDEQVDDLAVRFSVSRVVIARRALEQGLIDVTSYQAFFIKERERWSSLSGAGTGGSYYNNIPARNGRIFTNAVAKEAAVGRLMYREAGQLLGVQPAKVRKLYERRVG